MGPPQSVSARMLFLSHIVRFIQFRGGSNKWQRSRAVFPVFWGLYSERFGGRAALASSVVGLIVGTLFFPTPEAPYLTGWIIDIEWATQLVVSFGLALGASTVVSLALTALSERVKLAPVYDLSRLKDQVRLIPE